MKLKLAKILGILFSALFLFVSCGQITENDYGPSVIINLPHVNNRGVDGYSRSIARDDIGRLHGDTRKYRVIFQTSVGTTVVREGTGGTFSAYFSVGTEVSVTVECLNGNDEVIVRTVAKTLKVGAGENSLSFNLSQDGTEVVPPTPEPQPVHGTVTYSDGGSNVSNMPSDTASYNENEDVTLKTTEPTRPGYDFAGWTATVELSANDSSGVEIPISSNTPFASGSSQISGVTKITSFKMPAGGIVLTAQWTLKNYTVTFNTDGGNPVNTIIDFNINYGGAFPSSTKQGYSFQTWQIDSTPYTASTLKDAIKAGTVGTSSTTITLTAQWQEMDTLYVGGGNADDTSGDGSTAKPFATIGKAIAVINAFSGNNKTIQLQSNITASSTMSFSSNKTTILKGDNSDTQIQRGNRFTDALISVSQGTLKLENIILDGNKNVVTNASAPLIQISGGNVTVGNGVTLQNNKNSNGNGGGVYVSTAEGFTMTGGKITENEAFSGGGIYISNGASARISNAEITNNIATGDAHSNAGNGRGGGIDTYGELWLTNVSIKENKVAEVGNYRQPDGGGICISNNQPVHLSGKIEIINNTNSSDNSPNNLFFDYRSDGYIGQKLVIENGALATDSSIGVYFYNTTTYNKIVESWDNSWNKGWFSSDISGKTVVEENGSLVIQ